MKYKKHGCKKKTLFDVFNRVLALHMKVCHFRYQNTLAFFFSLYLNMTLKICSIDFNHSDAPPSSLCDPKRVQRVGFAELDKNLVSLPASGTKRGRGVVLEAPGLD
jgi:hypothetical protein